MSSRHVLLAVLLAGLETRAPSAEFLLHVTADPSTSFYDYFSDAFARMDLRDPPPNEFRQRMHAIPDPSIFYGPIDLFPNDEQMRFGAVTYDPSTLISGTGTAAITGLTLDLLKDPFNPTYENWRRFPGSTVVTGFQGTIDLVGNLVASLDLSVNVEFRLPSVYGSTIEGVYSGTFLVSGDRFQLEVEGSPILDTVFTPAGAEVHWGWFWSGTLHDVNYAVPGDLDGDYFVGQDDLNYVLSSWGSAVPVGFSADPSMDGFVGQDDLNIVLSSWGRGTLPAALAARAVPECSVLLWMSFPLAAWVLGRSRSRTSP